MKFTLFFGFFVAFSMAQYDDISILGEVLERSTGQPEGSGVEEVASNSTENATTEITSTLSTTTTTTTTEEPTTVSTTTEQATTTEAVVVVEKVAESTTTTTTEESTSSSSSTTSTTTTTEAPTTTENVLVPQTLAPEEDVEEESFLGFKKPDLATIYRRLFPFQHTPHRDYKL